MTQETQLILPFILKYKKERYLNLLSSKKGRIKFRARLPHLRDLDPTYLHKIKPSDQNISNVINQLKSYNAPNVCYIIAEHPSYDQKSMTLEDAFTHLFASGISYFIFCIPGKLAYYEGEDIGERYILSKNL